MSIEDDVNVKVEPKKRTTRNQRSRLTVEMLCGPRGLHTIEEYFKDIHFKGKGNEKHDLDEIIGRLKHWKYRMYPKYKFDDVLNNIERLGKKKFVQVYMSRYRLGMLSENTQVLTELSSDKITGNAEQNTSKEYDEFDALIDEQIEISKISAQHQNLCNDFVENHNPHFNIPLSESSSKQLTSDQMARISENYRLAKERLAAKRSSQQKLGQ